MTIVSITNSFTMEQPGRMFNRAPSCGNLSDPFLQDHYQHRRKLRQVNSYHDLADIPTVPTEPDMKGSCGVKIASPKSVTDAKRLDLSVVCQDDAGGVDIDLCFPEIADDENDDDDLFLMQNQQQQEQDRESCLLRPSTRTSSSFLAPISEEIHVTFASQHVVIRVDGENDELGDASCSVDQRFIHEVYDAVQVKFIPHHTEYDSMTRSSLWYTQAEMASMKEQASDARKSERRRRRSEITRIQQQQQQRFEKELDTCSLFPSFPVNTLQTKPCNETQEDGASSAEEDTATLSGSERRFLYESMVDAILLEQYEQKMMCLRVYGRVDEGFGGILDPCRLANVCASAGDTKRSHERAVAKARRALSEPESESDLPEASPGNDSSAIVSGSKSTQRHRNGYNTKPLKRSRSFASSSSLKVETSGCLDKSIGAVFQVLLAPFLDIPKGDLFLDIGEELSVGF